MTLFRSGRGACPVCGAAHATCGPRTTTLGVDERMGTVVNGGQLKVYDVTIGNNKTQMRLNDEDAKFYQEHHTAELAADQPKSASSDQAGEDKGEDKATDGAKARTPANKLGGAANK